MALIGSVIVVRIRAAALFTGRRPTDRRQAAYLGNIVFFNLLRQRAKYRALRMRFALFNVYISDNVMGRRKHRSGSSGKRRPKNQRKRAAALAAPRQHA